MTLLLLKLLISAGLVLTLTAVAERVSARLAGVLLGFPLGAGLSILFFGLEQGAIFTAKSALWGIPGILAALSFAYTYALAIRFCHVSGLKQIVLCIVLSLVGYFLAAALLQIIMPENALLRTLLSLLGMVLFNLLFRSFAIVKISRTVSTTGFLLTCRAGFSAAIVIAVTTAAHYIGHQWAGLFSLFPITLLPTVVVLHYHYGSEIVLTVFRALPIGFVAIVVFNLVVAVTFPLLGVGLGLLVSYAAAFLYLLFYEFFLRRWALKVFFPA